MGSAHLAEAISRALARRDSRMKAEEFMAILAEASESTETITGTERSFLVDQAHLDPDLLEPEQQADARLRVLAESAQADAMAVRGGFTTAEVAELLGAQKARIRRMRERGDLHAFRTKRGFVFPRWQFKEGRPIPHSGRIASALPQDMHPLDVEAFMTRPQEALGGRNALEWLDAGGGPEPVLELAQDVNLA